MKHLCKFPIIEAAGTPYEIGYAHGSKAKEFVLNCLETYRVVFQAYSDIPWEDAKKRAQAYVETIRRYNPDYLEEIRGIADGAGVTFEDILALNVRSELAFQGKTTAAQDGCTCIGITPERCATGDTLLSQNWDFRASQRDSLIILKIHQTNGRPDITLVTEAGIIGKYGFNSRGIGVCLNALAIDAEPVGLPLHIAMRGILEGQNLCESLLNATKLPLACSANFMIASACGEVVDIEIEGDEFDVLYAQDGTLVHTNHFRSLRLPSPGVRETSKRKWPDTFIRCGIAEKKIRACDKVGVEDLQRIFADHGDYPTSICHHEDPRDPEANRVCTVCSIIMNLTRREMYLCPGQPCEEPYKKYQF